MEAIRPILAFVIAWSLHSLLLSARMHGLALDEPNHRSLHSAPVPRTGGIAIVLSAIPALWGLPGAAPLLLAGVLLAAVSFLDDRLDLPVAVRLSAHLCAAALAAWLAGSGAGAYLLPIVLAIAWMTNLYNFMDGSDALAGLMAMFGFSAYAAAALLAGESGWALGFLGLAAASGAFLIFNWPPARIFMGDVGSIPLGFWAAAFGVWGTAHGWWQAWFPVAVFSPFIVDATVTLARRALRGEKVWRAHREHHYQRLVLGGMSKRALALGFAVWTLACVAWALLSLQLSGAHLVSSLAAMALAYALLLTWIHLRCRPAPPAA